MMEDPEILTKYYKGISLEQALQADKIAYDIAEKGILSEHESDMEKVKTVVDIVFGYCSRGSLINDELPIDEYQTVYGVFVANKYTINAAVLAMGRVLDYMDIKWELCFSEDESQWCYWICGYNEGRSRVWFDI